MNYFCTLPSNKLLKLLESQRLASFNKQTIKQMIPKFILSEINIITDWRMKRGYGKMERILRVIIGWQQQRRYNERGETLIKREGGNNI